MLVGEAISRVQSLYSKGVESDDSRLSSRHIYNKLITVRENLAINQFRSDEFWSEWDQQPLHKIPMKRFDGGFGCPMMKSVDTLPHAISTGEDEGIMISSWNGETIYTRSSFEHRKYLKGNKYTSGKGYFYIHDDYLYLLNSKMTEAFAHGFWRDPIQVYIMDKGYKGLSTCFSNRTVPMFTPGDIMEMTIQVSSQELIQQFSQMREDVKNNSADTPPEEGK